MKDKRGFELGINTVILLILGFLVLALVIGFIVLGGNNFNENIKGYFSYSNVDNVVGNCNLYAEQNLKYKYCCEEQEVRYYLNGTKEKLKTTCQDIVNKNFGEIKLMNCEISC